MHSVSCAAALAALLVIGAPTFGQTVVFDFEDGTDQGFGGSFDNMDTVTFPIVDIGGSMRMAVLATNGFQETSRMGDDNPFVAAMNLAMANPTLSTISYDWYVDTSLATNPGGFLELGTYINAGSGAYAQNGNQAQLSGAELGSGGVFSGTISQTFSEMFGALDPGFLNQTFHRLGLIVNNDEVMDPNPALDLTVYYDNVTINAIPEPASLGLLLIGGLCLLRRRR
jgi:hypothetical protein